ncbi:UDP-N-acetylglucosamine--N-acetylmuramyl-(pentapeptide) pyrophosphoryl-undecaprenol N-acetylglucosamine transferase [Miltoncostaea oceani]|uniref:UDP-N-acetylglucosamine--N-acetylmuramyl- (pentapeptide) pyrophosphoryl-undecaprenol N-acetylglucosamine transferase n=1 Tax=Miltoncostaea oceani TaxID=2843216 RepID=UPI001FEC32B3|nr:UDP-N-acetylglucosamine--N-acetylmuramyl-(pentapeptide) pyrophosphoryl-undecaprenol N-acetylglucosamine transferase [Miltoncostaea oceani]
MPALAVADALRARGAEVTFIGARGAGASAAVAAAGYREDVIPLKGLSRTPTIRNLWAVLLAAVATPRAAGLLVRRRAQVVVGGGSYVAGPVALAAWLTRRPLLLTEADSHLGMANRLAAPLARRVTLAFPLAGRSGRKYLVTGRPVGRAVTQATRTAGRRAFGIDPEATVVLVVGGSQGARSLNRAAVEAFGDDPPVEVIHVAGPTQLDETRRLLAARTPGPRYRLIGYLDNLPDAIAAADLVISRSGGSVFELAAIGRPSILVPYPHATADHQAKNARWLAEAGAAMVLPDVDCSGERLRGLVGALLSDRRRLEAMAEAARRVGRPDAADVVAEEALALARPRRRLRLPRPRLRLPRPRRGR